MTITIYELQSLVSRCIDEAEKAEFIIELTIPSADPAVEKKVKVLLNKEELVKHISRTIVGELFELEIIRRLAPVFREVKRLCNDFELLDIKEQERINIQGLRIAPEGD
jgi:hypothetical protein